MWRQVAAACVCLPQCLPQRVFRVGRHREFFTKALRRRHNRNSFSNFVRSTPESGHVQCTSSCLLWAKSGLMQCNRPLSYSITSLARPRSDIGKVRPNAFAVLRLIIISTFVDCWTGGTAGFSPLKLH